MKLGKLKSLLVLLIIMMISATAQARPKPDGAADFKDRQRAWERHQGMVASSPYAGLEWRSVGPVVQGGRLVDMEVVPGQPYTFYAAYASGGLWKTTNNGHTFEPGVKATYTLRGKKD